MANRAGVSTATVSHAINNTRFVSKETRERVDQAIKELDYTPNASARSFRTGKKKIIGFIIPDISNRFFSTLVESVERVLALKGYHLIIVNTKESIDREENNIRMLCSGMVDGLLVASTFSEYSTFEALIPPGFPLVLVDRVFELNNFSSITVSNYQPIYRCMEHLAGQGCKRIGYIAGLQRLSTTNERLTAYRQAVQDFGLDDDVDLVQYGNSMEKSAYPCLEHLMQQHCDAIVVANGLMAGDTVMYLQHNSIRIGKDIQLVCFVDYDSNISLMYDNSIDTIMQPVNELGQMAGEQILRCVEASPQPIKEIVLTSTYKLYSGEKNDNSTN